MVSTLPSVQVIKAPERDGIEAHLASLAGLEAAMIGHMLLLLTWFYMEQVGLTNQKNGMVSCDGTRL